VAFCREKGIAMEDVVEFAETPGQGVRGRVDDRSVVAGSFAWVSGLLASSDANAEQARRLEDAGTSLVAVGDEEKGVLGLIAIADRIKGEARQAVEELNALGLEVILLTGDNEATARAVGSAVGIARVVAKVLPGGKVSVIKRLQDEGRVVAMVGDGINDAPALKAANVGIAIGTGTDVAIETGDITLVSGELAAVVRAVRLSRATFRKIRQNLFWAFFYNVIAIPLAILGLLHPLVAEAAMALSSINVVTNANRLRRVRLQGDAQKMSG
jgi:Cu+-exporting ATPase